jgi:hypothetical protein
MTLYKNDALIPKRLPSAAETPGPIPEQEAPTPTPRILWLNSRWAVTEHALESRTTAGDPPRLVDYVIEAPRLLRVHQGAPGVSMWAAQLAAKSWVDDVEAMLEAIEQALLIHYPAQTVVDLAATDMEARRIWNRSHLGPRAAPDVAPVAGPKPEAPPDVVESGPNDFPPELPDIHREADDDEEFEPDGNDIGD